MRLLKELGISALASLAALAVGVVVVALAAPLVAPATGWWLGLGALVASIVVFVKMAVGRIRALEFARQQPRSAATVLADAVLLFVFLSVLSAAFSGAASGMRLDEALGGPPADVSAVVLALGLPASLLAAVVYAATSLRRSPRSEFG